MTATFDATYELDDRYVRDRGRVFLNGHQAMVRLLLMQHERDRVAGLDTVGFVSGYRGSPLGVLDIALWGAADRLLESNIRFVPGVNEELAATAVWGTQQIDMVGGAKQDGVFGMWYGKGPGVDRAGDALKTANYAGTSVHGGVLVLCGDDHAARSSSLAHQSEYALISFGMPILNPSSVQEYLDLGQYGYAIFARYAGCWVGFICITDTVETAASVSVDPERLVIVVPPHAPWRPDRTAAHGPLIENERSLYNDRLPAAEELVRLNRLDRVVWGDQAGSIGIVTCGKAYNDVRQALQSLGIDEGRAARFGLSVYKVAMTWPLEPTGIREFCHDKSAVLVVEEKRPLVEDQLKTILFEAGGNRPELSGKRDWQGGPLISNFGELSASDVARSLARWLGHATGEIVEEPREPVFDLPQIQPGGDLVRKPAFCSGCPHNTSTKVPDGSIALGGIGCHGMAAMMPERHTMGTTPMGSEGANWIGQSPFTSRTHIFQNLGDGTYYHSGILAIRAALSAGVNITYKILANDAVAMTGGQAVEGNVTAPAIVQQVVAEGVGHVVVVTDEPAKYPRRAFPAGVTVHHRRELDDIQRRMREETGVTVIVYDQACAAEKRRLRKRKQLVDPAKRVVINELVCEGCGDCNVQSNCISVEPLETEYGRKRRIDQSSCNKDFTCLEGYCPSFVTVHGGELKSATRRAPTGGTASRSAAVAVVADLADDGPRFEGARCSLLVTGVGGAGIVTLGSVIAMAAHLEGKAVSVLNVLGMAQKNGPVTSHVRISDDADETLASRIGPGDSDLVLGTDPIVTGGAESIRTIAKGRTRIVLNEHVQPTSDFASHPDLSFDLGPLRRRLVRAAGDDGVTGIEATRWASAIFGDAMMANMLLLGYACQLGYLPLGAGSLRRAIELNGQAVQDNQLAFDLGRMVAVDRRRVEALVDAPPGGVSELSAARDHGDRTTTLADKIERRVAFLTGYQNEAYGRRYRERVESIAGREIEVMGPGHEDLARAVADYYFKLLAYKDEYEVARLYTDGSFQRQLDAELAGKYRVELNLAPQIFNARDRRTGRAKKRTFGPWIFPMLRLLAHGKRFRGTALDPFGRTEHRRMERELIQWYEAALDEIAAGLTTVNHDVAVAIASIPESIRGYDTVKDASVAGARAAYEDLLVPFRQQPAA